VAAHEHFEPSVGIVDRGGFAGEPAPERGPAGPWPGVRMLLPGVPECPVETVPQNLAPSVRVSRDGDSMRPCRSLIGHGWCPSVLWGQLEIASAHLNLR